MTEALTPRVIALFLAAVVPLCTMIIGVTVLGEAASWSRIGLLCLSCLVIGGASMV